MEKISRHYGVVSLEKRRDIAGKGKYQKLETVYWLQHYSFILRIKKVVKKTLRA
jgi:hypothetical protein